MPMRVLTPLPTVFQMDQDYFAILTPPSREDLDNVSLMESVRKRSASSVDAAEYADSKTDLKSAAKSEPGYLTHIVTMVCAFVVLRLAFGVCSHQHFCIVCRAFCCVG